MNDVIIRVRNLVKRFGEQIVLDGVTFDVQRGETLVLMGGSGCGKSTLLNCLIGELAVDGGEILYRLRDSAAPAASPREIDISHADEQTLNQIRKRFGILFQSGALLNSLSLAENIALPLRAHSNVPQEIIDEVISIKLRVVHMLPHRDKMPSQLSGGQKKRAGLARATALDPEILFYDEPSAGLDPVTSSAIDELMMGLSKLLNVTSIVVTHEMDSAFRIADRMVMLDRGRVLKVGTRQEFDALRKADAQSLSTREDRLMHQFLNGATSGPLTDIEALSDFADLLTPPPEEARA